MPWLQLMDELKEIVCETKWRAAQDIDFLLAALYRQIGPRFGRHCQPRP